VRGIQRKITMPKVGASSQFMALKKHGRKDRERWQSTLKEIKDARLPVEFYEGDGGSQAALLNEQLDEQAQEAFSSVAKMIARIENGELLVRPLTKAEAEDIGSTVESGAHPPHDPEESVARVEGFADQLVTLLEEFTREAT
jgi:hypothetical protein